MSDESRAVPALSQSPLASVLISYRRRGGAAAARVLREELSRRLPGVAAVLDVEVLRAAEPFGPQLKEHVENSRLLIAVISSGWLEEKFASGPRSGTRRLDDANDWVRIELET